MNPPPTQDRAPTVTDAALRRFMRRWPGGVAVVTSADPRGGQPAGCTVSAFLSVSLRPPLVLISLGERSRTLAAITEAGTFCVNVLGPGQRDLARRFAATSGDRFANVRHRWESGVPVLEDTVATAVCGVERIIPAADHVLLLGAPQWCRQDESADPVVFFEGSYYVLPPRPLNS